MTEQPNMGLTWESRLSLALPGSPLAGTFLFATTLIVVYLAFEWLFGLHVFRLTIILLLLLTYALMCPRFFALREALEWSFDSSTLVRFGLYLLIPVGSMIGGALVERVIDALLA